jgi:hypothetical protein
VERGRGWTLSRCIEVRDANVNYAESAFAIENTTFVITVAL